MLIKSNAQLALFIVRIVIGSVFVLHGGQKVFGWFGGQGMASFSGWLLSLGIPKWLSYAGAVGEFVAGIMVLLGIATEVGAFILIIDMIFAIYLVHGTHGYFIQSNGMEYPLNLILLCIALIIGGPGYFSVWKLI